MDNLLNECRGEKRGIFVTGEKKSSVREVTKVWGHPFVQNKLLSAHKAEDYKTKITFPLRPRKSFKSKLGGSTKSTEYTALEGALTLPGRLKCPSCHRRVLERHKVKIYSLRVYLEKEHKRSPRTWGFVCSVQFRHSVVSDSLRRHGPQHARPPCPSPTPGVYPNSCPLECHPSISFSVVPFSCPHSFPASGSFQMSQFFASGGQSIGVSASASALPENIQD